MCGADVLQTLAEIAIALAGFDGVIVVLRRDPSGPLSAGESADLLLVVGGSLLLRFFALLPLLYLGAPAERVWQLASALLAAARVGLQILIHRSRSALRAAPPPAGLPAAHPRRTLASAWSRGAARAE